jgi:hypothetical protein
MFLSYSSVILLVAVPGCTNNEYQHSSKPYSLRVIIKSTVINFKLKDIDKIIPVTQEPNLYLSWFWLTDGDLWLTFGDQTICEYSKEAMQYFGDKPTPFAVLSVHP